MGNWEDEWKNKIFQKASRLLFKGNKEISQYRLQTCHQLSLALLRACYWLGPYGGEWGRLTFLPRTWWSHIFSAHYRPKRFWTWIRPTLWDRRSRGVWQLTSSPSTTRNHRWSFGYWPWISWLTWTSRRLVAKQRGLIQIVVSCTSWHPFRPVPNRHSCGPWSRHLKQISCLPYQHWREFFWLCLTWQVTFSHWARLGSASRRTDVNSSWSCRRSGRHPSTL